MVIEVMRYDDVPYRHIGNEETGTVNANGKLPFALRVVHVDKSLLITRLMSVGKDKRVKLYLDKHN
jgi:hypothetical protein